VRGRDARPAIPPAAFGRGRPIGPWPSLLQAEGLHEGGALGGSRWSAIAGSTRLCLPDVLPTPSRLAHASASMADEVKPIPFTADASTARTERPAKGDSGRNPRRRSFGGRTESCLQEWISLCRACCGREDIPLYSPNLVRWAACAVTQATSRPEALERTDMAMPEGTIKKLTDRGFGFIALPGGKDIFFHSSNLEGVQYEDLHEGQKVSFVEGRGPKGPRAEQVKPI